MVHSGLVINEGTQTPVAVDTVGTLDYGVVKLDMGATGLSNPFTGTITEIANVAKGTTTEVGTVTGMGTLAAVGQVHNAGTIAALPDLPGGTIDLITVVSNVTNVDAGTIQINPRPTTPIITYGTTIGGTVATGISLIAAPGVGTSIYLNEISITNQGTAPLSIHVGFGTAATAATSNVLSGFMAANGGGIEKPFPKAVGGHITNLALLGSITAAGTVNVNLSYWVE